MKTALKKILSQSAHLWSLDSLVRKSGCNLIMPFYHVVSNEEKIHFKHLYPLTTTKRFGEDLDFLMRNYTPVSYDYVADFEKRNSGQKAFFLSFDDGLSEFYDVVAPALLERGIPATCFVNSAFVDNKDMFYRMKVSILIERVNVKSLSSGEMQNVITSFRRYGMQYKNVFDFLSITYQNRLLLDEVASVLEVNFSEYLVKNKPYLTSEQIEGLRKKGFTFGSHSVSHPYYYEIGEDEQVKETLDCLKFLTENFDIKERLFSFPFTDYGVKKSFFERIEQDIDLTFGTANIKLDSVKTNFQRIPMEVSVGNSAEDIIKSEYLNFIIKRFFGKHIIKRS